MLWESRGYFVRVLWESKLYCAKVEGFFGKVEGYFWKVDGFLFKKKSKEGILRK